MTPDNAINSLQQSTTPKDMTAPEFVTASIQEHRSGLLSLNVGRMSWVFAEVPEAFHERWRFMERPLGLHLLRR